MSGVYLTMSWLSPDRRICAPELGLVGSVVLVEGSHWWKSS
ncbi:MAG: hypothetical protein ABEJ27_00355 [Halodesulfurarchaeum sp.]